MLIQNVLDKGESDLEYKQILSEKEYSDARETWGNKFPFQSHIASKSYPSRR